MKEPGLSTRAQLGILVGLVLLFGAVIALAPFLSSNQASLAKTEKKLRARAGTERQGARALVSDSTSPTPPEQKRGTRETPLEGWDAPRNWDRLRERDKVHDARPEPVVALNPLSVTKGLGVLRAQLASAEHVGAIAQIYAAMGALHAQQDPPNLAAAAESYNLAAASATTAEERHGILHSRIETLHEDAAPAEILALIEGGVDADEPVTVPLLQLEILRGAALEKLTHADEAEDVYARVMAQAQPLGVGRAEEVYRQAAMRLARLYRSRGREREAEAVVREVRKLAGP